MTSFGWDASDFDWDRGRMDIAAAARDGIEFFTHKATESTNVQHKHFGEAVARARDAGIRAIGAYHVVRSGNVGSQVDYFLSYIHAAAPWLLNFTGFFVQADVELWDYDKVSASQGEAWADLVEPAARAKALVYASKGQYGNGFNGTSHFLWNANYGINPAKHYREAYPGDAGAGWTSYSGRMPMLWQYGSRLTIGSQPTCDANAFRGNMDAFMSMIGRSSANNTPGKEEEDMQTGTLQPGQTLLLETPYSSKSFISLGCDFGTARVRIAQHIPNGDWDIQEVVVRHGDGVRHDLAGVTCDRRSVMLLPLQEGDLLDKFDGPAAVGYLLWGGQ